MASIFKHRSVLITGGSSGIGLAVASRFLQYGATVSIVARDKTRLERAARALQCQHPKGVVRTYGADVGSAEEAPGVIAAVIRDCGGIDTLVANAGVMMCGRFHEQDSSHFEQCMRVNYFGALYWIKAAWPHLTQEPGRHLAMVASVAGYVGLTGYSSYAPTKFALSGLAECLRMEGRPYGLNVSILYPPDTTTPMLELERQQTTPEARALSARASCMSPDDVAARLVQGMERRQFEIFCNSQSRLVRLARAALPKLFFWSVDRTADAARSRGPMA